MKNPNLLAEGTASGLIEMRGDQKRRGEFWAYCTSGLANDEDLGHFAGSVMGFLLNEIDRLTEANK